MTYLQFNHAVNYVGILTLQQGTPKCGFHLKQLYTNWEKFSSPCLRCNINLFFGPGSTAIASITTTTTSFRYLLGYSVSPSTRRACKKLPSPRWRIQVPWFPAGACQGGNWPLIHELSLQRLETTTWSPGLAFYRVYLGAIRGNFPTFCRGYFWKKALTKMCKINKITNYFPYPCRGIHRTFLAHVHC